MGIIAIIQDKAKQRSQKKGAEYSEARAGDKFRKYRNVWVIDNKRKIGRDDRIWTCDHLSPRQVRYQAALHPDYVKQMLIKNKAALSDWQELYLSTW